MTTQKIPIRDETKADVAVISAVTAAAFETLEISSHTEQFIVEALRFAKALTVSLVAEVDGRVVAHIAFSSVTISDGTMNWYGLGPVSVLPEYQRRGIGSVLIRESLSRLKGLGGGGCCLVSIRSITGASVSRMLRTLSVREFLRRFSLYCQSTGLFPVASCNFIRHFRRMAHNRLDRNDKCRGETIMCGHLIIPMLFLILTAGEIDQCSSRRRKKGGKTFLF
ncbi:MAG: N-acetyltransferase [Desulfurivibrionaceae bacterium]|nr:N-acetyltransferase [Desulfurivibrionaceae bacterium]